MSVVHVRTRLLSRQRGKIVAVRRFARTGRDRHTGLMGTTTPASPRVVWVGPSDDELIEGAIALGDQDSKTLGFMPHEAYKQAAAADTLIAVVTDGKVIAYALYSLPRPSVKLKH